MTDAQLRRWKVIRAKGRSHYLGTRTALATSCVSLPLALLFSVAETAPNLSGGKSWPILFRDELVHDVLVLGFIFFFTFRGIWRRNERALLAVENNSDQARESAPSGWTLE